MEMRDRERGTVFWSFGYPENIDQTHQLGVKTQQHFSDFFNFSQSFIEGLRALLRYVT